MSDGNGHIAKAVRDAVSKAQTIYLAPYWRHWATWYVNRREEDYSMAERALRGLSQEEPWVSGYLKSTDKITLARAAETLAAVEWARQARRRQQHQSQCAFIGRVAARAAWALLSAYENDKDIELARRRNTEESHKVLQVLIERGKDLLDEANVCAAVVNTFEDYQKARTA